MLASTIFLLLVTDSVPSRSNKDVISDSASNPPTWDEKNLLNYRIYTPTFFDSNGDGIGDFRGIEMKLGELRKIGITCISPSPIFHNNFMGNQFYPDAFTLGDFVDSTINPQFGTESELISLIDTAHQHQMTFIADIPLTVSKENAWYQKLLRENYDQFDDGPKYLLNVADDRVQLKLFEMAQYLLRLGVDGLYFTDYSFSVDSQRDYLDPIIEKVLKFAQSDKLVRQKNVAIFVDEPWREFAELANFTIICTTNEEKGWKFGLSETIVKTVRRNKLATPKPMWMNRRKLYDIKSSGREDKDKNFYLFNIFLLLFLPGPVQVFYGEEFGFYSSFNDEYSGVMHWSSSLANAGFSKSFHVNFDFGNMNENGFEDEFATPNSFIHQFKNLAMLRFKNPVFEDGELLVKIDYKMNYLCRRSKNDKKAKIFILVFYLPFNDGLVDNRHYTVSIPNKFINNRSLENVEVIAHSPSLNLTKFVNMNEAEIKLKPYEGLVLSI